LDRKTGERYDFIDDTFVKSQTLLITQDEIAILSLMVQELSDEKMCELLEISSVANFKYKKRVLFQKLDVSTSAGAVHKAHLMGVI
jgi:ATP/maltotriose-dependent transcriptional regulator MalT